MALTTLEIDVDLLVEAAEIFGTSTKRSTVEAALRDAIAREKRREFSDFLRNGGCSN
jgi:Arc/MetJ family transcription regulator